MPDRSFAAQWQLDETFSDRIVAFNGALRRLLRTPAPDLPALAAKIALAVDHDAATLTGGERCMRALKRDAERLLPVGMIKGVSGSRAFVDPEHAQPI
jgi:hypothetical protein